MDVDIDYGRAIQSLSIMDKQLCYPLSESGNAQMFDKSIIGRTQETLERAQEYIGFLYDKYKQLQKANRKLYRKKTANYVVMPKDKIFAICNGEIRQYIIKDICVFGSEGQCLYNAVAFNGSTHAQIHEYPSGFELTEYDFGHTVFLTMEDAINELRKQRKSADNLCDNSIKAERLGL